MNSWIRVTIRVFVIQATSNVLITHILKMMKSASPYQLLFCCNSVWAILHLNIATLHLNIYIFFCISQYFIYILNFFLFLCSPKAIALVETGLLPVPSSNIVPLCFVDSRDPKHLLLLYFWWSYSIFTVLSELFVQALAIMEANAAGGGLTFLPTTRAVRIYDSALHIIRIKKLIESQWYTTHYFSRFLAGGPHI